MVKMQSEKNETQEINIIVCRYSEKLMRHFIKIIRIPIHKSKPDEVKVEEVKNKEGTNRGACPDHESGKKRCLCLYAYSIPCRSCPPVLYLDVNTIEDMDQDG